MPSAAGRKLLITGAPGVGKTTLIRRLVRQLDKVRCAGFFTAEIREAGVRKGFTLVSLDGQKEMLAHVEIDSPYRVGRYGVDVRGFDRFLDAIDFGHGDADVVIVDEIGKMEILSKKFLHRLDAVFASRQQLVATISSKGPEVIQRFKKRRDVKCFEVTRSNRERLAGEIVALTMRR